MVSNLLFSRRRLCDKVRPPVYRSGGSSLAASCQPHVAPALAHVAYARFAALLCASAGPVPARERHWQGTATTGRGSRPLHLCCIALQLALQGDAASGSRQA